MISFERVVILRRGDVALYGRVLDQTGKLGRYEVNGHLYHSFVEAEAAFNKSSTFSHSTNFITDNKYKKS